MSSVKEGWECSAWRGEGLEESHQCIQISDGEGEEDRVRLSLAAPSTGGNRHNIETHKNILDHKVRLLLL